MGGTDCGGRGGVKPAAAGGGGPQGQALRRLVRRRESAPTDNAVEPVRCRPANMASGPASADFEHVVDLPLTAGRFLAALRRGLTLLLADEGKSGAKVLILDNGRL
jgi:hypothetical protein